MYLTHLPRRTGGQVSASPFYLPFYLYPITHLSRCPSGLYALQLIWRTREQYVSSLPFLPFSFYVSLPLSLSLLSSLFSLLSLSLSLSLFSLLSPLSLSLSPSLSLSALLSTPSLCPSFYFPFLAYPSLTPHHSPLPSSLPLSLTLSLLSLNHIPIVLFFGKNADFSHR